MHLSLHQISMNYFNYLLYEMLFSYRTFYNKSILQTENEAHAANPPSRTIPCEQEGCHKMFTTRENMKSHVLNQHRGRKPCSLPGISFPCTFPGCGKKFSFRSTLYRHKKLVHKGGDYKLGRHVVQYPCTYDGG